MSAIEPFEEFADELRNEIEIDAEAVGAEALLPEVFCQQVADMLVELGAAENLVPSFYRDRGLQVSAYGIDGSALNLAVVDYDHASVASRITKTEVTTLLRRLRAFWDACRNRRLDGQLEESSDAHDMVRDIQDAAASIDTVNLFLLTNRLARIEFIEPTTEDGIDYSTALWDLARIRRLRHEGHAAEAIRIDFERDFGGALPALPAAGGRDGYRAYLAFIPGDVIAEIYAEYGSRLLERNVRSFLQFTVSINRGMRDTLKEQPERFLAYNNGISATAARVDVTHTNDGVAISAIEDLQIVNGGQTTVSIARAREAGIDLSSTAVQAKITEVQGELLEQLVPAISRYANSQNRVSVVDLSSNHPFQVALEEISRRIWVAATEAHPLATQWFYERARGLYADTMHRQGTPAKMREFKRRNPPSQKITKPDIAKYENAWALRPHDASRGAQKSFVAFMAEVDRRNLKPDEAWWKRLVAKAIVWKHAERIVSTERYGYRAAIVAYALAKLVASTQARVDLGVVWGSQAVSTELHDALVDLARLANGVLTNPLRQVENVTEWAKREAAWKEMLACEWRVPASLETLLIPVGRGAALARDSQQRDHTDDVMAGGLPEDDLVVQEMSAVPADVWFALSNWAKQTENLSGWDRRFAYTVGTCVGRGKGVTVKQAPIARRILDDAKSLGFDPGAVDQAAH